MKRLLHLLVMLTCFSHMQAQFSPDSDIDREIASSTHVSKGQEAPDFTCTTTEGSKFSLMAQRGKVVVLYFFASSAPACFTELKYVEKGVHQQLRGRKDFVLLGIGRGHTRDEVVRLGGQHGLTFRLAADEDQSVYERYFSAFVPRIVVLDRKGRVCHMQAGSKEYDGVVELMLVLQRELQKSS
jgi:peroxiredoxin